MRIGIIVVLLSGLLWLATRVAYDWMIPGVPDAGPYTVPASPVGLWGYASGERLLTSSSEAVFVWLLSMMTFIVPPMIGRFLARMPEQRIGTLIASVFICCIAWLSLTVTPSLESHRVDAKVAAGSVFLLVLFGWILGFVSPYAIYRKKNAQQAVGGNLP